MSTVMSPGSSQLSHQSDICYFRQSNARLRICRIPHRALRHTRGNCAETGDHQHPSSQPHRLQQASLQRNKNGSSLVQVAAVTILGIAWLLGRPGPAAAGVVPRDSSRSRVETVVSIPPSTTSVTASVTSPNDSMVLIVGVCLGFWMLSATISAVIGAVMHLSGRSLKHGTRAGGGWTSAGILDTFDIMQLPLAYEVEEPAASGTVVRKEVIYKPWDGPESSYIPVNMVKVLEPGLREAGLVVRKTLLQAETDLSIISVNTTGENSVNIWPLNRNGGGTDGKNGHSNKNNANKRS